ncbi:MAG: flagellar export protein FliJ [Solirubrobacteraceae bacterium]
MTGPSFRFRLERVRALRERGEKLAQEDLAQSISRLSSSQAELRSAEAEVEHALEDQRRVSAAAEPMGGAELRARQAFLERVEAERSRQLAALRRSEADVADSNAKLAVAAGEHEMLLRLRERRRGEHDREQARRESNANDEIAAARFGRSVA